MEAIDDLDRRGRKLSLVYITGIKAL